MATTVVDAALEGVGVSVGTWGDPVDGLVAEFDGVAGLVAGVPEVDDPSCRSAALLATDVVDPHEAQADSRRLDVEERAKTPEETWVSKSVDVAPVIASLEA